MTSSYHTTLFFSIQQPDSTPSVDNSGDGSSDDESSGGEPSGDGPSEPPTLPPLGTPGEILLARQFWPAIHSSGYITLHFVCIWATESLFVYFLAVEEGNCGKTVVNINKSLNETRNGIRYNCTINKPLKRTECVESCDLNGRPVVCQIYKAIRRRKGYTCVPYRDGDQEDMDDDVSSFTATNNETVTTGCQCFTPDSTENPAS